MAKTDFRDLVKVGAHFGHVKSRLNPKMSPYIWGVKNNVNLFNVATTAQLIDKAAKFLEGIAANGKTILWVGTKKSAQEAIKKAAKELNMPSVSHRWIGGTLSNFSQVKKSVTKLLHFKDVLARSDKFPHYTKKELNVFSKVVDRLEKNVGGIKDLKWPLGAVVFVDVVKERSALQEAATMNIPTVAIVDSNANPALVDNIIPANDDSAKVINFIIDKLVAAVSKGKEKAKELAQKAKEEAEAKKVKLVAEGKKAKPAVKTAAKSEAKTAEKKPAAKKTVKAAPKKVAEKKEAAPKVKAAPKKTEAKKVEKESVKKTETKK